ncbi:Acyl-CoA dehydrogenase related to the alkylation response protein AidB [Pseudomonas syringae pv. actinidiae]|uniref:Acyl-CoA dehydrogenase related to the alkylation response protein AidB n=1 Tax=Pseudomonas syringae pv. actinidiae TaxID=103796 RepID=A0AAN4Q4V5_PSESF|nr:Acyl-CoA dehydrogenase related to the alkylation response protein AidB [Pseudomonas syringae pv. actinidiae]
MPIDGAKVSKTPGSVSVTYVALCVVSDIALKSAFVYVQ